MRLKNLFAFLLIACLSSAHAFDRNVLKALIHPQTNQMLRLSPIGNTQSHNKKYHIRLQQYYQNVPIYGGVTIIHSNEPLTTVLAQAHPVFTITGRPLPTSLDRLGDKPAQFFRPSNDKFSAFIAAQGHQQIVAQKVLPIIYIDQQKIPHWAYKMTLHVLFPEPSRPSAIIDAKTQEIYHSWNDLKTIKHPAFALGYGGNVKIGLHTYGEAQPPLAIKRDDELATCFLENKQAKVINMHHQYRQQTHSLSFHCPTQDNNHPNHYWTGWLGNGYDKINEAYSPSNDALYFAEMIKKLYQDWYGQEPLYHSSGLPKRLVMRVHYGENYANAFWDGQTMTFGDGDARLFYPFVSLGIAAHEISHGFTEQHADLVYYDEPGAINESFSDMAAIAAENYANYPITWEIGSEIIKPQNSQQALRYMDQPHRDGKSFDSVESYRKAVEQQENTNVHYGSGVFNRLFYLIATSPGYSIRRTFEIMINANAHYWHPLTNFEEGGCDVLQATKDLHYEAFPVEKALKEIGINPEKCDAYLLS